MGLVDRINLREAARGDELDLWRVHVEALEATVDQNEFHASVAEFCPKPMEDVTALKGCVVVVAELDGEIVGYSGLNLETGCVFFMFIVPKFMRLGIGRRLLMRLEAIAADRGLKELRLSASIHAHEFYKACGFVGDIRTKETGSRTGLVYEEYLMRKNL